MSRQIVIWGRLGEICGEYLHKGSQVYIEGRLQARQWGDREGNKRSTTEIVAQTMQMLGGPGGTASPRKNRLPYRIFPSESCHGKRDRHNESHPERPSGHGRVLFQALGRTHGDEGGLRHSRGPSWRPVSCPGSQDGKGKLTPAQAEVLQSVGGGGGLAIISRST